MRTLYWVFGLLLFTLAAQSQQPFKNLETAITRLKADSQMKHALLALQVVNSKTGSVIYSYNENIGLAAASSQKVITAAAAYELLGKAYRFKTTLGYSGTITDGTLKGNFFITGYGDPTLGSNRYGLTKSDGFINNLVDELGANKINTINGSIIIDQANFSIQPTPGGWIWDDIGNYYGAGHFGFNWRENQYDLILKPGREEGDGVEVLRTVPELQVSTIVNQLSTGKKGSGDHGYIYLAPFSNTAFVMGTVPAGVPEFTISGSFAEPALQFKNELSAAMKKAKIGGEYEIKTWLQLVKDKQPMLKPATILLTQKSPALDSIIYWFLRKSINLYGEALLKAIAFEKTGYGSTEKGLTQLFNFWQSKGVDSNAIRMMDGSGLSPQNRITAKSFVQVLGYAKSRPWYPAFYDALPTYNGIKMKSGTIGGTKSFTGYVTDKSGNEYMFAIIINNYTGSAAQVVNKMYKVLDQLK